MLIERSTYFHANFVKDRTGLTTISKHMLLYTNIDQKLRNKIHGPLHALNHKCYVCIQWTQCIYIYIYIYYVMITRQSNPPISKSSRPCKKVLVNVRMHYKLWVVERVTRREVEHTWHCVKMSTICCIKEHNEYQRSNISLSYQSVLTRRVRDTFLDCWHEPCNPLYKCYIGCKYRYTPTFRLTPGLV